MTEIARLVLAVDSTDIDQAQRELKKLGYNADKVEGKTKKLNRATDQLSGVYRGLRTALAAVGFGLAIRQVVRAADTYQELRSQLRLVTDSQTELNQVYADAYQLANDTRGSLEGTIQLYSKLARSTESLGLSNEQLLTITKAVNQSFVVSGASAQEAEGAIRQLAQGLASGTLRGDELNSVMENSPRLARALADGLGVTIGQLRALGADGKITAENLTAALLRTADSIDREFQTMPRTVGQALQQLQNDLLNTFGQTDTSEFVSAIDDLRGIVTDPGFQESMVKLGSAIADVAGWIAQATANTVDFVHWIGEELSAAINGPAGDDLVRMSDRIIELREQLDQLEGASGRGNKSTRIFQIKKELEQLERQYEDARKAGEDFYVNQYKAKQMGGTRSAPGDSGPLIPSGPSDEELAKEREKQLKALTQLQESLYTEEEAIEASYQRRMEILANNTVVTEEQRKELEIRLAEERVNRLNEIEDRRLDHQRQIGMELLSFTSQQLSITTNMLAQSGKKNSSLYKTLIAIQRAAAIPSIIISTQDAAAKALAWGAGGPAGIALSKTVTALGYSSAAIAGAQAFSGFYDNGGFIPSGSYGIAGERGPEIVKGPAQVTSRRNSEGMTGGGVTVNLYEDASKAGQTQKNEDGSVDVFVASIRGDGPAARVLEATYGLRRVGN